MEITLGDGRYTLVPQRIGRIRRKLTEVGEVFGATAAGDAPSEMGASLYEALKVFIPDLVPYYVLMGFSSAEAMEADEYDEAADRSPTPPEIIGAVESIFELHGGARLVRLLKNVVGPELIRAALRTEGMRILSERSQSSRSANGESALTSSMTTGPTATPSEDSPSPERSTSSTLSESAADAS